jgi:hypothetical protein
MQNDIEKLRQFLIQNPYFNLSAICIKLGVHKQLLMNFVSKGYGLGTKEQEDKVFEFFRNFGYNDTEKETTTIETVEDVVNSVAYFILKKPLFDFPAGTKVNISDIDMCLYIDCKYQNQWNHYSEFEMPLEFGLNSEWLQPITNKKLRLEMANATKKI